MDEIGPSESAAEPDQVAPSGPCAVRRVFGRLRGKIWIADDFDAPLPDEILDQFENGPVFPES